MPCRRAEGARRTAHRGCHPRRRRRPPLPPHRRLASAASAPARRRVRRGGARVGCHPPRCLPRYRPHPVPPQVCGSLRTDIEGRLNLRVNTLTRSRVGGGGHSTSVECLLSITSLPGPAEISTPPNAATPPRRTTSTGTEALVTTGSLTEPRMARAMPPWCGRAPSCRGARQNRYASFELRHFSFNFSIFWHHILASYFRFKR